MNAIGQRTEVNTSGTALPNVPAWLWGYDSLGQVTSADSSVSTSDRGYQYDTIGNRLFSEISNTQISNPPAATTTSYTPDALNQYSSIGNQQSAIVNPTYDFDGNAEAYPLPVSPTALSTPIWNAENRLTEVKNSSTTLEKNLYDAQFRRIATTAGTTTTLYLYDSFNCIAEYTGTTLAKTRSWGMDLSGSMQGAGGVGGLLAEEQGANTFYPRYDGNGNISEYLVADGSTAAHFEYDPFGNTVVNTDSSNQFAYRFSTKPLASATGFYYYGYRYYDPVTGRWPFRDPIVERGGLNLYGFVGNDGVTYVDILCLKEAKGRKCLSIVSGNHGAATGPSPVWQPFHLPDEMPEGVRSTVVSCFSGGINNDPRYRSVDFEGEQFDNLKVLDFLHDNDSGDSYPNPREPGFLRPERSDKLQPNEVTAQQALRNAVEDAKRQAEQDCLEDECPCGTITVRVVCGTDSGDKINFPIVAKPNEQNPCYSQFTYDCEEGKLERQIGKNNK